MVYLVIAGQRWKWDLVVNTLKLLQLHSSYQLHSYLCNMPIHSTMLQFVLHHLFGYVSCFSALLYHCSFHWCCAFSGLIISCIPSCRLPHLLWCSSIKCYLLIQLAIQFHYAMLGASCCVMMIYSFSNLSHVPIILICLHNHSSNFRIHIKKLEMVYCGILMMIIYYCYYSATALLFNRPILHHVIALEFHILLLYPGDPRSLPIVPHPVQAFVTLSLLDL